MDELFDAFERLAVIYISRPKQKMIFIRNNFEKNIALFGGAVTVNSPDFTNGKEPFIFMQDNDFLQNMAYLSGNAVFIRNSRLVDDVDEMCAGITMNNNQFTENLGTKRSNGGAISLVCKVLEDVKHEDYESTSSYLSLQAVLDPYKD